jgi:SMODS and SLOG-associating 2TM effector domain 3/SMODS and SLOG-associating 2TM effector domain 1
MTFKENDLPPLYHATDKSSLDAQSQFLWATRIRLFGVISAALFGLFTWQSSPGGADWAGAVAASSFTLALVAEAFLLKSKPERTWYQARAAAESVKTLSWRFAVGGEPFKVGEVGGPDVSDLFLARLRSIFDVIKDLELGPPTSSEPQITQPMKEVRGLPLVARKTIYETGRVANQQDWYRGRARKNRQLAHWWTMSMLTAETAGIICGIFKAIGTIERDWLSFSGVIVAAIVAWLQAKQYQTLATAYTVTALELASVRSKIADQNTEDEWSTFVSDAEEAFSREHTLWKASRGIKWH